MEKTKTLSFTLQSALAVLLIAGTSLGSDRETVLHNFTGTNGLSPYAALVADAAGNLYGTTVNGGTYNQGTVFELTPSSTGGWQGKVLYTFTGAGDGGWPYANLILDSQGNLYGTADLGGITCGPLGSAGCGLVFRLSPGSNGSWTENVLYAFTGGSDGAGPLGGLIFDKSGNLYGTTSFGGYITIGNPPCIVGCGVAFRLTPAVSGSWTETVLHAFGEGSDLSMPYAAMLFDAAGNLYGTANTGGAYAAGGIFELSPSSGGSWTETVLYSFTDGSDGAWPQSPLLFDGSGSLYGAALGGGNDTACPGGCGVIFKLSPSAHGWRESVIHTFSGGSDGALPVSIVFDSAGNLYGAADAGGSTNCPYGGCGTIFKLTKGSKGGWIEGTLHEFTGLRDGGVPYGGVILDAAGDVYGTTSMGGYVNANTCPSGCGNVFELLPKASE